MMIVTIITIIIMMIITIIMMIVMVIIVCLNWAQIKRGWWIGDCEYVNYDVDYYVYYDYHHYDEDGSGSDAEDFYEGVLPMGDRSRGACFKLRSFKIQVI